MENVMEKTNGKCLFQELSTEEMEGISAGFTDFLISACLAASSGIEKAIATGNWEAFNYASAFFVAANCKVVL